MNYFQKNIFSLYTDMEICSEVSGIISSIGYDAVPVTPSACPCDSCSPGETCYSMTLSGTAGISGKGVYYATVSQGNITSSLSSLLVTDNVDGTYTYIICSSTAPNIVDMTNNNLIVWAEGSFSEYTCPPAARLYNVSKGQLSCVNAHTSITNPVTITVYTTELLQDWVVGTVLYSDQAMTTPSDAEYIRSVVAGTVDLFYADIDVATGTITTIYLPGSPC